MQSYIVQHSLIQPLLGKERKRKKRKKLSLRQLDLHSVPMCGNRAKNNPNIECDWMQAASQKVSYSGNSVDFGMVASSAKGYCQKMRLYELSAVKAHSHGWMYSSVLQGGLDWAVPRCTYTPRFMSVSFNMLATYAILLFKLMLLPEENVLRLFI